MKKKPGLFTKVCAFTGLALMVTVPPGLLTLCVFHNFWAGMLFVPVIGAAMFAAMGLVWLVFKLPFMPSVAYMDCYSYVAILAIGSAFSIWVVQHLMLGVPAWAEYAIGGAIAIGMCILWHKGKKGNEK